MKPELTNYDLPRPIADFIAAVNRFDLEGIVQSFAADALVNPRTREFWGHAKIRDWAQREIVGERVILKVVQVTDNHGNFAVDAKFDGDFDKSGLPDPFVLSCYFALDGDRIVQLIMLHNNPA